MPGEDSENKDYLKSKLHKILETRYDTDKVKINSDLCKPATSSNNINTFVHFRKLSMLSKTCRRLSVKIRWKRGET